MILRFATEDIFQRVANQIGDRLEVGDLAIQKAVSVVDGEKGYESTRTQSLAHGIPDLHVFPPDGRPMLSHVQFVLVKRRGRFCLRVCFGHGDISISGDGNETVRRGDDRLWCVVPRVPGAERRRANV